MSTDHVTAASSSLTSSDVEAAWAALPDDVDRITVQRAEIDFLRVIYPNDEAVQKALAFQESMLTIQTMNGHSEQDLKQLSQEIMDLAKEQ